MPTMSAFEIARRVGGTLSGDADAIVSGAQSLERAREHHLSFLADGKQLARIEGCKAGVLIAPLGTTKPPSVKALVESDDPDEAFNTIYPELLPRATKPAPGVHPTAVVPESCTLGKDVHLGAYVVLGENVTIGDGSVIHPHCVIMEGCVIGANCLLYPHCSLREFTILGDEVMLESGVVLGANGFGYKIKNGELSLVPQAGNVELDDKVHVGANSCIDRARFANTRVGRGTKIDNLVQVGHNTHIGSTCGIAGMSAIGGSVVMEDFVHVAGNAAIANGLTIGSGAKLFGRCGVDRDIEAGETLYWAPARPPKQVYRLFSIFDKLPELVRSVKRLEEDLSARQSPKGKE